MADDSVLTFADGDAASLPDSSVQPPLTKTTVVVGNDGARKRVTVAIDKTAAEELRKTAGFVLAKVNIDTNAAKSPPKISEEAPAPLPEKTVTGITKNVLTEFTAVTIGKYIMDKVVGYDWLYMKAAAAKDGINLSINSSFRTPAEQQKLIDERMDPTQPDGLTEVGRKKGRAGPIDGNNAGAHLMGQALDIDTGVGVAKLQSALIRGTPEETAIRESYVTGAKKPKVPLTPEKLEAKIVDSLLRLAMADYSRLNPAIVGPTYLWLVQNGPRFGFTRSVPSESWHYSHFSKSIVSKSTDRGKVDTLVAAASSAASTATVLRTGKPEATLALDRTIHDVSKSFERSAQMSRTSRSTLFAEKGKHAVFQGAGLTSVASRYEAKLAAASLPPPKYKPGALDSASFDYDKGTWADGSKI